MMCQALTNWIWKKEAKRWYTYIETIIYGKPKVSSKTQKPFHGDIYKYKRVLLELSDKRN